MSRIEADIALKSWLFEFIGTGSVYPTYHLKPVSNKDVLKS